MLCPALLCLTVAPAFATTCGTPGGPAVNLSAVIPDDLDVPAGAVCNLHYSDVKGNTTVEGRLNSFASHFSKDVHVTGGIGFDNYWTANTVAVEGNLIITATGDQSGFWLGGGFPVIIGKNLIVSDSTAPFYSEGVIVRGNAIFDGNQKGVTLGGNTVVSKNLNCDGNTPAPLLGVVTAAHKNGQCSQ
jgi:hypothetical protein